MTGTTRQVDWKKGREDDGSWDGRWEAFLNGELIASCYVNESASTGYWNRYQGALSRVLAPQSSYRKRTAATLREFKDMVAANVKTLPGGHELFTAREKMTQAQLLTWLGKHLVDDDRAFEIIETVTGYNRTERNIEGTVYVILSDRSSYWVKEK